MIDFHTHILPQMDDGARSTQESVEMLRESVRQGVYAMAATPHYDAEREAPTVFLARRARSYEALREKTAKEKNLPEIRLGAEVRYFDGMSGVEAVQKLCIEGTGILLLEMPFRFWSERMIREIKSLYARQGVRPLLAHIDRYPAAFKPCFLDELQMHGALIQANAEFFMDWRKKGCAARLVTDGCVQILGSDCHNMGERRPNLAGAVEVIRRKCGECVLRDVEQIGLTIWKGWLKYEC